MQIVLNESDIALAIQEHLKSQYLIVTDNVDISWEEDEGVRAYADYSRVTTATPAVAAAPTKKRRSSVEVQAEREAKAKAKAQAEATTKEEPTVKVVVDAPVEDQVEDEPFGHSALFPEVAEKAPEEPNSFLDGLEARATHQLFP